MTEYVRSVRVRVEVDTNKQTHILDRDDLALDEVEDAVRDFIAEVDS